MRQREKAYEKGSGARMMSHNVFGVMPLAAWKAIGKSLPLTP
jgi:hypothetical protein